MKKYKRFSDPRFHLICSGCYLLKFQDPAARNKYVLHVIFRFQDPAARNKIFQNIPATIRCARNFPAEEYIIFKGVGSNSLHSRSQDASGRNKIVFETAYRASDLAIHRCNPR